MTSSAWTTALTVMTCAYGLVTSQTRQTDAEYTPETFPNPQLQQRLCSRGDEKSWVCDPDGVIPRRQADALDALLTHQARSRRCICGEKCASAREHTGVQGAIALVNKMHFANSNPSFSEKRRLARKFADHIRGERWEFDLCNDDYVIFVSVKDRQVFTATGDSAQPLMTDVCVKMVYEQTRPTLAKGDIGGALEFMVKSYSRVLDREHPCNAGAWTRSSLSWWLTVLGPVSVIVVVCLVALLVHFGGRYRRRRRARARRPPPSPNPGDRPGDKAAPHGYELCPAQQSVSTRINDYRGSGRKSRHENYTYLHRTDYCGGGSGGGSDDTSGACEIML